MRMDWLDILTLIAAVLAILHYGSLIFKWLKARGTEASTTGSKRDKVLGISYAILCAGLWSISYTSLSIAVPKADIWEANVVLLGIATLTFLVLLQLHKPLCKFIVPLAKHQSTLVSQPATLHWKKLGTWLTLTGNIFSFLLFIFALYYISASQSIALQKTNPIFAAILGTVILRRKVPVTSWTTIFFVLIGSFLIINDFTKTQDFFQMEDNTFGSLLALGAGFSFALFSIGLEKSSNYYQSYVSRLRFLLIIFFFSFVIVLTFAYYFGSLPKIDEAANWIFIFNGIRIAVVYLLFWAAIERIGTLAALILVSLEVPLTIIWDYLWLGLTPPYYLIIGAIIIILGGITLTLQRQLNEKS